jgi:pimeloyl-ACP methyl ester carboxylesterase
MPAGKSTSAGADPVLLLHGQPGSARDWRRLVDALDGRAHSVAIDRPGWDRRTGPADLAGNAAAAARALDGAGIERATVVGHSFGAAVAAWLAATQPQRVAALVLVAPAANADSLVPLDRLLATPLVGDVLSVAALAGAGLALANGPLRRRVAGALGVDSAYLRSTARRLMGPATWRAFTAEQRTLVRELPALERRLWAISAPTTIVAGVADRIVPLSSARRLGDQIPRARVVEIAGADHLLPQHRAAELAELVLAAPAAG